MTNSHPSGPDDSSPGDAAPDDAARDDELSDLPPRPGLPASVEPPISLSGRSPAPDATPPAPASVGPDPGSPSILQTLASRTGVVSRISLQDAADEHGNSPVLHGELGSSLPQPARGGSYQMLGEIARGAMGQVLKGHDNDLGRDVAIKVLLEKHADSPTIVQRFVEEAQIGGQLQHPGIVPVYGLGLLADERPYFTMKLVKGRTLAALLADRDDPGADRHRFLTIFEQVCQTLAYAHARRVIHRDLKPANIMVGAFGEVQVVDWGLAKVLQEGGVRDEDPDRQLPRAQVSLIETVRSGSSASGSASLAGSIMGTPSYMSPEQARGEIDRLDERTDVFALGSILCEILTGSPAYSGRGALDMASRSDQGQAHERLRTCGAEEELVALVTRCLSAAKRDRPRNAEALVQEVQAHLAGREEAARQAQIDSAKAKVQAAGERKARRLTLGLAAAVLVIVMGGGGSWMLSEMRAASARETTAREVGTLLAEAGQLGSEGDFDGALATVAQAQTYLADRDAPADIIAEVEDKLAQLSRGAKQARQAEADQQRLDWFLESLGRIQESSRDPLRSLADQQDFEHAFRGVFEAYGLDAFAPSHDAAVKAILATGQQQTIAQAIDDWARFARKRFGWHSAEHVALHQLAQAVDPDPVRTRMREALLEENRRALEDLASSEAAQLWPPQTVLMFVASTGEIGVPLDTIPLLRACHIRHPDDAHVSDSLARQLIDFRDPPAAEEALRFLSAAVAAKPDFALAKRGLINVLHELASREPDELAALGLLQEAEAIAVELIETNPEATWVAPDMARLLVTLLNRNAMPSLLKLSEAIHLWLPDEDWADPFLALALLGLPPRQRDPDRARALALEALQHEDGLDPRSASILWGVVSLVEYWDADLQAALAALDRSVAYHGDTDPSGLYLRAILLARLGQRYDGRPSFDRAEKFRTQDPEDPRLGFSWSREFQAEAQRLYRD